jgi:hypothetical protein
MARGTQVQVQRDTGDTGAVTRAADDVSLETPETTETPVINPAPPDVETSEPGRNLDGGPLPPTRGRRGAHATEGVGALAVQTPAVVPSGHPNAENHPELPRWAPGTAAGETQPGIPPPGEYESVVERPRDLVNDAGDAGDANRRQRYVERRGDFVSVAGGKHMVNPAHVVRTERRVDGSLLVVTTGGEITIPAGDGVDQWHEVLGTGEPHGNQSGE